MSDLDDTFDPDLHQSLIQTGDTIGENFTTLSERESVIASRLGELRRLIGQYESREAQIAKHAETIRQLQASIDKKKSSHSSSLLEKENEIQEEIIALETTLRRLTDSKTQISARIDGFAASHAQAVRRINGLLEAETECRRAVIDVNERIAELTNSLKESTVDTPNDGEFRYWSQKIEGIVEKICTVESVIPPLNSRLSVLRGELAELGKIRKSAEEQQRTFRRSFEATNDGVRRKVETAIDGFHVQEELSKAATILEDEIVESIASQTCELRMKTEQLAQTEIASRNLRSAMCQKEQHHGRLRGEIAEVDATNSVLRQSNSRKEAEKRFQIIRMRKERDATLDLIGRAQQELRALRASRRSLVNELEAIGQRADKARVASTLMQKGADKLVESSEVVDDSLAVEAMVHSLKQLNRHLELAQRHNEVLEAHTFVDLPVVPPSEDHSRLDHLRRKLKAVKKTVRRLRARIADFRPEPVATPPAAVLPSLPVNVAVPSLSMARLENIESRVRTLESSVLKRRGVIQHKRSRLSRVNDFYLNPPPVCENLHFCDRCMHRYEQYRPQPQDWELLLEKLKMELALWKGSQLPSVNLLSIWNNQVEHFIRSVAVG